MSSIVCPGILICYRTATYPLEWRIIAARWVDDGAEQAQSPSHGGVDDPATP